MAVTEVEASPKEPRGKNDAPDKAFRRAGLRLSFGVLVLVVASVGVQSRSHRAITLLKAGLGAPVSYTLPEEPLSKAAPAIVEPVFPYLDGEPTDETLSVGDTSSGCVVHAQAVTESDSLAILPKQRERDLKYGTAEMVAMLEQASETLHKETSTRLWLGNIGKRGGGDIAFSVSHNAGRDADVALSYLDASGRPIDPPDLVPLGKDGFSKDRSLQLDPKRTWITVRALVGFAGADVEYIFLSDPLRKKILAWARDHGEKPSLIERAADVVRQPVGAAPHDDHLHVRIYCSNRDLGAGCIDTGPPRQVPASGIAIRAKAVEQATKALAADDPLSRARAALRLALLGETDKIPLLVKLLDDASPNARHAAVTAIARLGQEADAAHLAKRFSVETDPAVRERILIAAAILGGAKSGEILRAGIAAADDTPIPAVAPQPTEPGAAAVDLSVNLLNGDSLVVPLACPSPSVRAYAVAVAAHADRLEPVPDLISLLAAPDGGLRASAAESLACVTNQRFGDAWSDDSKSSEREAAKKQYELLWKKLEKTPRNGWVALGFNAAGFKVRAFDKTSVWELVRATSSDVHLSYNARKTLSRFADDPKSTIGWSREDACSYYLRLFQQRRFRLDKPPPVTSRACSLPKKI